MRTFFTGGSGKADPSLRRRNLFAYIDTRDLGQLVQRCLEIDGLGYQLFNVADSDLSVAATTQEIGDPFYDDVELRREMGRDETHYAIDRHASSLDARRVTPGATYCGSGQCFPDLPWSNP